MLTDRVPFISAMQRALLEAAVRPAKGSTLCTKVVRSLDRTRIPLIRAVNANVSFRTAAKLKKEGVL